MLTLAGTEDNSCFKFIGMNTTSNEGTSLLGSSSLLSNTTSLLSTSNDCGMDTCSFYSGPSDATIFTFGESSETCGSIAYSNSGETCGSIAYSSSGESCGSVASFSSSTSSFSGGCSYSC